MRTIAILTLLLCTTFAFSDQPTRLMFNQNSVSVITSASTNQAAYTVTATNGILTVTVPLTNAPVAGCVGMLILIPQAK